MELFAGPWLSMSTRWDGGSKMEQLDRRKVADIAQMLLRLSDGSEETGIAAAHVGLRDDFVLAAVRAEQVRRAKRHKLLGVERDVFADPGWDILLELFVARLAGARMSSSTIGLEAGIPQSTALRWLGYLHGLGLVERVQDVQDRRRQWVALSDKAATGLRRCFA